MSDPVDDLNFWGRQLLKQSELTALRASMAEFVSEHQPTPDLMALRRRTTGGTELSALVKAGRNERV